MAVPEVGADPTQNIMNNSQTPDRHTKLQSLLDELLNFSIMLVETEEKAKRIKMLMEKVLVDLMILLDDRRRE